MKPLTVSRRARLILAAGIALILFAGADMASAKNHNGNSDHAMNSGKSVKNDNKMRSDGNRKQASGKKKQKKKENEANKKPTKSCLYITSDGKRCGGGTTQSGGTKPTGTTQTGSTNQTGGTTTSGGFTPPGRTPAGPVTQGVGAASVTNGNSAGSKPANVVTVSNGVTKIDIPNTPQGLIVSSNSPGSITVFNGFTSQTLRGGSVTLSGAGIASGAITTQTLPGLQSTKLTNGDVSVAINPPPATAAPAKPAGNSPQQDIGLGAQLEGAAKNVGRGLEHLGEDFIDLGGPTPQPKTGTITQQ